MHVLCGESIKGDGIENEDEFGFSDNTFWVIDGASDLFGLNLFNSNDDVAFYVRTLSKKIKECMNDQDELSKILLNSIYATNEFLGLQVEKYEDYKLPSFAILIGRIVEGICEYYILGDCFLAVYEKDGVRKYTDNRLIQFTRNNREGVRRLIEEGLLTQSSEKGVFIETRKCMNKKDGYWIGSPDGKGVEHGIYGKIQLSSDAKILGFTDGFAEAFDVFEIDSLEDLDASEEGIAKTVSTLRSMQDEDFCRSIVRVRSKDDLTYILIER